MAISAITSVFVDRPEYTKYYQFTQKGIDYSDINATALATGTNGDLLYFTLVNLDNNRPVAARVTTLNGGIATATISLKRDCYDELGIYRARQGNYAVVASTQPLQLGIARMTDKFAIMAASAVEMREIWLRGIPLSDEGTFVADVQGMAGVVGVTTRDVQRGGYPLVWDATARTLSWQNGPPIVVPSSGPAYNSTLWADTLDQTTTFTITPTAMPGSNTQGYLFVDYGTFDDIILRNHLNEAYGEVEGLMDVPLEPTQTVARIFASQFPYADDLSLQGVTFRPAKSGSRPMRIQLPVRRVMALHAFGGYAGTSQVINVPNNVAVLDGLNGIVELVPSYGGTYAAPTSIGLMGYGVSPYGYAPIITPQFWQAALTYGVGDLSTSDTLVARESVFRIAAINILGMVGRARTDILGGTSFSRDGASLSRQYTNGQWGVYSDLIYAHVQWLDQNAQKLRDKIVGREVSVAGS